MLSISLSIVASLAFIIVGDVNRSQNFEVDGWYEKVSERRHVINRVLLLMIIYI